MSKKVEMPKMKNLSFEELKKTISTLEDQLQTHMNQMQYHQTMTTKAQGAIEVLNQIMKKQEKDNDSSTND